MGRWGILLPPNKWVLPQGETCGMNVLKSWNISRQMKIRNRILKSHYYGNTRKARRTASHELQPDPVPLRIPMATRSTIRQTTGNDDLCTFLCYGWTAKTWKQWSDLTAQHKDANFVFNKTTILQLRLWFAQSMHPCSLRCKIQCSYIRSTELFWLLHLCPTWIPL